MKRRQTMPARWLVTDDRLGDVAAVARGLARGSGILVRNHELPRGERSRLLARLRRVARARGLVLVDEAAGSVRRVHDAREIARARLAGADWLFVSPLFATRSHLDMRPLPRMRAAALARLAGRQSIALGGMDEQRFRAVRALGFQAWAGIDAWLRT